MFSVKFMLSVLAFVYELAVCRKFLIFQTPCMTRERKLPPCLHFQFPPAHSPLRKRCPKSFDGKTSTICPGGEILTSSTPRAGLRGHAYRLLQGPGRVVKYWNRLPAHLVLAPSISIFKKQLDRHWFEIFPAAPV